MAVIDKFWFPTIWGKPKLRMRHVTGFLKLLARLSQAKPIRLSSLPTWIKDRWRPETNKKIAALGGSAVPALEKNKKIAASGDTSGTLGLRTIASFTVRPASHKSHESHSSHRSYSEYRTDPAAYARDILKVQWWAKQQAIAQALLKPPHRVLVKACHSVGKTHVAAGLVNWWYDTHDPGVVLTTAPTARQVQDVLWKEVRTQRRPRGGFVGPKVPRLQSSPNHFAHGFTANDSASFQGQHEAAVLIILDEAVGVDAAIWEAADSMVMGVEYGIVAICNPTDTSSEFYRREQLGGWEVVHIDVREHPNIAAELRGEMPPVPSAVRLAWLQERLKEWCQPVSGSPLPSDIEWPPGSGKWLRPGPLAEARLLGRWPSAASGVWSDLLWSAAETRSLPPAVPREELPEIGCDVARFGDDSTAIHVRWGMVSLHHETANGWSTVQTAGRLKQLAAKYADFANDKRERGARRVEAKEIAIKIDDDGVGGGVVDLAEGYCFIGVSAASSANRDEDYPNKRSELWFDVSERARSGQLCLRRLSPEVLLRLRTQALAPTWRLDSMGRRVVETKERTKSRLGRSPDDMDALNLAYSAGTQREYAHWVAPPQVRDPHTGQWREESMAERLGLFGLGQGLKRR